MKKIRIAAAMLVTAIFLISCITPEPVQEVTLMDDTWYVITHPEILMLCKTDNSQKEYIDAIKLLKGDSHSVEAGIEKLKSMKRTVEINNALGIGEICLAEYEKAAVYLDTAFEMAETDSQRICILNNQIQAIQEMDGNPWGTSAKDKYNVLMGVNVSDPIQNLVLRSNMMLYDSNIDSVKNPDDKAISALEKLLKEEKSLLGSNQMVGILNYIQLASIYIDCEIDIQKGIDYLNLATKLNAETYQYPVIDISVSASLSDAYSLLGEYDQALEYISKWEEDGENYYIAGHPDLITAYLTKGATLYRAKRYDEAINCFEKLIIQTGEDTYDSGTACFNLGLVYYKKENMEKAVEYFAKSYCIFSIYEGKEDINDAKNMLWRIYEEGGYGDINPDFDKWMEEQISQYGSVLNE